MGRLRTPMTTEKMERWIKEGRGQGEGATYKPWLTVPDVPSKGRMHRVPGWKVDRTYHFMSDLELACFDCLEWAPDVVDIREQFPLLPRSLTLEIADELCLRHPVDPGSKEPIVMTSDFCITFSTPEGPKEQILTVKPAAHLEKQQVLVKFEIERRYWERRGIPWAIVTEKEIPITLSQNSAYLRPFRSRESLSGLEDSDVTRIANFLTELGRLDPDQPLRQAVKLCEDQLGYSGGTGLPVVRHLLANRIWLVDMMVRIDPARPLALLTSGVWTESCS